MSYSPSRGKLYDTESPPRVPKGRPSWCPYWDRSETMRKVSPVGAIGDAPTASRLMKRAAFM